MTELESVNFLLNLMGSPPVTSLTSLHPDAQSCYTKLKDADRTIQIKGWWFNTDYNVLLTPDATSKELAVPSDTLKLIATSRLGVVQRGAKAYDTHNNTYQFDAPVYVNYVRRVTWDLLDETVQEAAKFLAGYQICTDDLEDDVKADNQKDLMQMAMIQLKKDNLRIQRRNVFTSPRVSRAQYRVRPYNFASGGRNPLYPGG